MDRLTSAHLWNRARWRRAALVAGVGMAGLSLATPVTPASGASLYIPQATLVADDAAAGDAMGRVAIDGDTAVVGAANAYNAGIDTRVGAAYVFVRTGTVWARQATLVASDADFEERFGTAVAISGDTIVVGAPDENIGATEEIGAAYVFERTGDTWTQQQKLMADDPEIFDSFGLSVAIVDDTVLIGADFADAGEVPNAGAAYVFEREDTTWAQKDKLTAQDAASNQAFGKAVALSGTTAVIGASNDDHAGTGSGAAYVFERSGTGWAQQAKLTAPDAAPGDVFGLGVAVRADTAAVSASFDDLQAGLDLGSVHIFERTGGAWAHEARLSADDGAPGASLGASVALGEATAVVGSPFGDGAEPGSGVAYGFEEEAGAWSLATTVESADGREGDAFGGSVAQDGDTLLIGAPGVDLSEEVTGTGAAYVFIVEPDGPAGLDVSFDGAASDGASRALTLTGTVACPAGQRFNLSVAAEQGGIRAQGAFKAGTCTGGSQPFEVLTRAGPGATFAAGAARACGRIETSLPGQGITDRATMCGDVTVAIT